MRLTEEDARARLVAADHGVLSTVHADRGVDAVPAVYAVDGEWLGIPVDRVKAKSSTRLQRARNLETDPRAVLLVEQWDREDWSRLWWVRAQLRWAPDAGVGERLGDLLAERFTQYRERPFSDVLVLRVVDVTGWQA